MFKKISFLITLIIFAFGFLMTGAVYAEEEISIAMIFPSTIDDMAWSQAMYDGVAKLEDEYNLKISYSENLYDAVQVGSALREYAPNYDIVIAHGAQYQNIVDDVARDFPNTTFAFGTSYNAMHDNVYAYDPNAEEGAYISGVIAAHLTETNIIGIIGPVEAGDAIKYNSGFLQGVKSVNPDIKVNIGYTGSFGDTIAAKQMAESHIDAGADILTGSAQQSVGAIRAAAEKGKLWFSTDIDQSIVAPQAVVASQVLKFEEVVRYMIEARKDGIYGGEHLPMTYANGFLAYEFNEELSHLIDAELEQLVNELIEDFKSGELEIEIE